MSDNLVASQDMFLDSDDSVEAIAGTPQHYSCMRHLLAQQRQQCDSTTTTTTTTNNTATSTEQAEVIESEASTLKETEGVVVVDEETDENTTVYSDEPESQLPIYDMESFDVIINNLATINSRKRKRTNSTGAVNFENNFSIFTKINSIKEREESENLNSVKPEHFYSNYNSATDVSQMEHFTNLNSTTCNDNDDNKAIDLTESEIMDLCEDITVQLVTDNVLDNEKNDEPIVKTLKKRKSEDEAVTTTNNLSIEDEETQLYTDLFDNQTTLEKTDSDENHQETQQHDDKNMPDGIEAVNSKVCGKRN
ncbi:hypothetical protein DOLIC_00127 [Dolichomitus sp. PSUC_FEM 10030005]|nr:hypothetical protein [Dolichomitus sp. PSUC_FEM 10030005]